VKVNIDMATYNSTSTIAEEFINDGKIRQTLAFAEAHKNDLELMRAILEKGRE
jgi:2-iminoacetate synthase